MMEDNRQSAFDQRPDDKRTRKTAEPGLALGFLIALAVVGAALLLPNDLPELTPDVFALVPAELPLLLVALALVPLVLLPLLRWLAALLFALMLVLKLADMAAYEAMARPFNPILDAHLLDAVWNLAAGTFGHGAAIGLVVAAIVAMLLIAVLSFSAMAVLAKGARRWRRTVIAASLAVLFVGWQMPRLYPETRSLHFLSSYASDLMQRHVTAFAASLKDLEEFEREARVDRVASIPDDALFSRLEGRDVLLFFVESYGRTVLANQLYAPSVRPILADFEETVAERGLSAASGFLTSPVAGGRSWLGHASTLSGLWVDNQRRYNSMIVRDRKTLIDDFSRAGYRTVAVMPAITMAWPEGTALGYDAIYDEDALGYRGLPFNWVTMPDQYTLAALDRLERLATRDQPIFAEVALISSHAPWTPIPHVIPWQGVGDGSVFAEQATSGDTPKEVWSDPERVRTQFRLSIEYALKNLDSYVAERLEDGFVLIILGDHQPARLITGETDNRDVPVHIISDDREIVDKLADALGFTPGMTPAGDAVAERMSVFRGRVAEALSEPVGVEGEGEVPARPVGPT